MPMNKKTIFAFFSLLLLLIPRVIRYHYPEIYIEDDFYLQNAFLMTQGEKPYQDFILNHYPLLEILLKNYFSIFGTSIRTA